MSHWYDSTPKKSRCKRDSNPGPSVLEADALTTRPTRPTLVQAVPALILQSQALDRVATGVPNKRSMA